MYFLFLSNALSVYSGASTLQDGHFLSANDEPGKVLSATSQAFNRSLNAKKMPVLFLINTEMAVSGNNRWISFQNKTGLFTANVLDCTKLLPNLMQ